MSNKSGASSQVISLPQGGGALQGIGETFSPDLHTGTGNFTIPIALPPARNGFQPQLSLVYSTGNGNGAFGLGWGLSIPGVMRKTAKGLPEYRDRSDDPDDWDTFVLSGAEDLVPLERSPIRTRYQPRTEGLFARIEHHHDSNNDYWQIWSKDGLISYYGTPNSRGIDLAVIAEPADPTKIYSWKLSLTVDPFGNRIEYEYDRDRLEEEERQWNQLYLKQIRYADYGDRANPQFLIAVKFSYEERSDPFSEYRSGFEIRTRRRCTHIEIFTQPGQEILTKSYRFIYLDRRNDLELAQVLPLNGISLLSQVKLVGHDEANPDPDKRQEELPPLEFGYTTFEPEGRDFFPIKGRDLPARSLGNPEIELADLFGNGLPDILEMNGTVRYWRNLGNGEFALPQEMKTAPAGLQLGDPGVQMIDADGDGRIDLMVHRQGLSGYFPLRFGGLWDRKFFKRYDIAPSFAFDSPDVQLMDLNGDGVTDAIRSGSRLECFENHPDKGWHKHYVGRIADEETFNFADPRIRWGDMSGDGLQDIVQIYDGNIEYWPNLGYGKWGKRVRMANSPRFRYGYDPRRILIGDIDGDGLDDLIYVDDKLVILWINQSGNGWSDPIEIKGTPSVTDLDSVRLVDLLGTGLGGILWSADANGLSRSNLFFLDLTGGVKPYLLHQMDNHMGAVTRVRYVPSTKFYLEDWKRPENRWQTPLPMPVLVVDRVEVIDQISKGKLTTEYQYHHGYWDGAEREFRGFGRVEQLDTEVFEDYDQPGLHGEDTDFEAVDREKYFSPPLLTKTWFHQGPVGDEFGEWEELDYSHEYWNGDPQVLERPQEMMDFLNSLPRRVKRDALRTLRGQVLRTELYALDDTERQDRPYTVTEAIYGVREESPPDADERERFHIFFSFPLSQRTTQWERGEEPMTQFSFTTDYDEYGQPRKQIAIACARGWQNWDDARRNYLATYGESTFAQRDDELVYIVERTAKASSYELKLTEPMSVAQLKEAALEGTVSRELVAQSLNYYDGKAFEGLPLGEIGDYGALVRGEILVLTEEILQEAYKSGAVVATPPEVPPYLIPGGSPPWTAEYPQGFRESLSPLAGYTFYPGDADRERGYFVTTARHCYDFHRAQGRGLLEVMRDPLGRDATITYDAPYELLPEVVTDPVGLTTEAIYDYRVLQPLRVTEPNGNWNAFTYTPLGLLESTAVIAKDETSGDDLLMVPSTRLAYDFLAFDERQQPISVRTIQREYHVNDTSVPFPKRDRTIETVEYSDGFGRLVQTRNQAEDVRFGELHFGSGVLPLNQGDEIGTKADVVGSHRTDDDLINVVVSGWQIYDNKGQVVEKYEPFYSQGWDYQQPSNEEMGQKVEMYYDPRVQVILTINPDGSRQRVIYGIPDALSNPSEFRPTPWEAYTYDANDLAKLSSHPNDPATSLEHQASESHHFTPSSIVIDALGRTIEATARNGSNPATDWHITRSTYDIRGNLLTVTDALNRVAFRYSYDLTPSGEDESSQVLRIESIDAGIKQIVFDAVGNEIERRDSKDALILSSYDSVNRPLRVWARDNRDSEITLREHLEYGDGSDRNQPEAERNNNRDRNLLGRLTRYYDEAGLLEFENYDFKGNLLEKVRRVISDESILSVFNPPPPNWSISAFRINWEPPSGTTVATYANALLDAQEYRTEMTYDALNRAKLMHYPQDVEGNRKELRPQYNRAGALERVELDSTTYVEQIAYNAKGQRTLIAYGNGVMTRYAYDAEIFRLVRLRTEKYNHPDELTYRPTGTPIQDFAYQYDLVGNITAIQNRTPASGILNNPQALETADTQLAQLLAAGDALVRRFTYDPIYRLLSATGRECDRPPETPPWVDAAPRCTDLTRTRSYTERYQYDPMGNVLQLQHQSNNSGFTRRFEIVTGNNRLANMTVARISTETNYAYTYNVNGNLTQENSSRYFEWDHSDQMKMYRTQTGNAEPSVHAHYLYDGSGQRVKKLVRKQGGEVEVTVYIDGIFEERRLGGLVNNVLHVMDDQSRIALVRVGTPFPDDSTPAVKYQLGDHLGSSNVVISGSGNWVNREEYTPYGETSFGGFAKKRYRFTGKERDEESGLNYHGARYYAPWLARWISCDPAGMVDGLNLYFYTQNNPLILQDTTGMNSKPKEGELVEYKTKGQGLGQKIHQAHFFPESLQLNLVPGWTRQISEKYKEKVLLLPSELHAKADTKIRTFLKDFGPIKSQDDLRKAITGVKRIWVKEFGIDKKIVHEWAKSAFQTGQKIGIKRKWQKKLASVFKRLPDGSKIPAHKKLRVPVGGGGAVLGAVTLGSAIVDTWKQVKSGDLAGAAESGASTVASFTPAAPLVFAKDVIKTYHSDETIQENANDVGDWVADRSHPVVGGIASAGHATGESIFKAILEPVGTAIGEGTAEAYIRLKSDEYTLIPWKSQLWSDIFD